MRPAVDFDLVVDFDLYGDLDLNLVSTGDAHSLGMWPESKLETTFKSRSPSKSKSKSMWRRGIRALSR